MKAVLVGLWLREQNGGHKQYDQLDLVSHKMAGEGKKEQLGNSQVNKSGANHPHLEREGIHR